MLPFRDCYKNYFQATYPSVDAVTTATLPDNFLDPITAVKTKNQCMTTDDLLYVLQLKIDIFEDIEPKRCFIKSIPNLISFFFELLHS